MSAENTGSTEPFDLEKLRQLIALMEEHGLSEIDLRRQDQRWKVRRGPSEVMQMLPAGGFPLAPVGPGVAAAGPSTDSKDTVTIKSPTVGTFYEAPAPG